MNQEQIPENVDADRWLNVARELFKIADALQPLHNAVEAAFNGLGSDENKDLSGDDFLRAWYEAVAAYNAAFEPYVAKIAELTGNAESTLRSVYGDKSIAARTITHEGKFRSDPSAIWLSPADLRNIGRYSSFNDDLWKKYSGMERPPKWTDDEILANTGRVSPRMK